MPQALARVAAAPEHHPIILKFEALARAGKPSWCIGFMDVLINFDYTPIHEAEYTKRTRSIPTPVFSNEYLEWIDLLESVDEAKDSYVMLELGAGYGRWGVYAGMAARLRGISKIKLGFAEAEPQHVVWLKEHILYNRLSKESVIYPCIVSDKNGEGLLSVGIPEGYQVNDDPQEWWGQHTMAHNSGRHKLRALFSYFRPTEKYFGYPLVLLPDGWKAVRVPQKNIRAILADFKYVDFIDMDVQGEELKIVQAGIHALNKKVKRIHIGTHTPEVEAGLRQLFQQHGWQCRYDYPCLQCSETPYGPIDFEDGVQSWLNPRL